jgi:hypothetical protein
LELPAPGELLQIKLGQLHGASRVVTTQHIDHALSAEIHTGGLPRGADVIDDNSANTPWVAHVAETDGDTPAADVVRDDLPVHACPHETAD